MMIIQNDKAWVEIAQTLSWPLIIIAFAIFVWKWLLPFINRQIDKREEDLKTFISTIDSLQQGMNNINTSLRELKNEVIEQRNRRR